MSIRIHKRSVLRRFLPTAPVVSTPVLVTENHLDRVDDLEDDLAPTARTPGPICGLSLVPKAAKPMRKVAPTPKVSKAARDLARALALKASRDAKKRSELCRCGLRLDKDHRRETCDLNNGVLEIAGSRSGG